jgi:hypothetical protein
MAGHFLRVNSLDVQNGDEPEEATIWLDLAVGYFDPAEVRGEDDIIPGASGREAGQWQRDIRRLQMPGFVRGIGGNQDERSASWHDATVALMAVMQLYGDPVPIEVDGPYLGIPTGTTRTLNARCVRVIPGPVQNLMSFQPWSFELECIDSPPEWADAPS